MDIQKVASSVRSVEKFVQSIYRSSIGLLKVMAISSYNPKIPITKKTDCVVLGNGPSLNETIAKHKQDFQGKSLMAVNNFVVSPEFMVLQPTYYVMLDPGYFLNKQSPVVVSAFKILREDTTWDMVLYAPYLYRKDKDLQLLASSNPHIKVTFYNYTIVKGFEGIANFLYRKNLAAPQFYNVLGMSVFLAVNMGYKNVWVTGADHGWFQDVEVDEQNQLYRKDAHFYTNGEKRIMIVNPKTGKSHTMGVFFEAMYKVFDSYYLLNKYAVSRACNVYNASEFSYIDAFERKKIND